MAKTKQEIGERALRKLGKLALGQTAEAKLQDSVEDAYDQVYARLKRRNLVEWDSADSVPDEFVEDMVALVAFERSEGIPQERYVRIALDAQRAQANIAAIINGTWVSPRVYRDY